MLETVILRDLKIAYGMSLEMEFIAKLRNLRVFVVELNDLRGSDRISFPKLISDMTKALSNLRHLECVELTQKPGNTSCTFDDADIDPEHSIGFLRSFENLLHRNPKLQRINIFYPLLMQDMEKFANLALPKIFGTDGEGNMVNFYGLNCLAVRNDFIEPDFLDNMYKCYEWDAQMGKEIINTKNYKYKKGVPSLLP